ncbi:hypothetical protein O181_119043 [Austropuccinia psidii MF-1]|uniref:Uncharacterized protein n=1 Tax=Austropuccinia psidii MF-1 TaxID=1389203 RepID=A0A9Q3KD36_9BASI|nr:hypothetical protein [Austropuccinia psidii MF-1]
MDQDQNIQVINPKDKNVAPEERHKWRMPELPPVPKDLDNFQQEAKEIYQPVSVQELIYGGKEEGVRTSSQLVDRENELLPSGDQKKELAQKKDNSHVEASQASTSKIPPQKVADTGKKAPKKKAKQKQKGKVQVEQALPSELQNYKGGKGSYGKCIQ